MAGRQLDLDRAMGAESFQATTDMPALGLAVCGGEGGGKDPRARGKG